jgi:hypothetical protein
MCIRRCSLHIAAFLILASALSVIPTLAQQSGGMVSGQVIDANGPVSSATVRVRATDITTTTGERGAFTLENVPTGQPVEITAWARGYYIAYTTITPPAENVTLTLRPYHTVDNPGYEWGLIFAPADDPASGACQQCHPMIVPQWADNAHGTAIDNPRFYSLYNGTNLDGTQPVAPGYVLDFPGTAGTCASCHAPGAAVDGYVVTDMNAVRGEVAAGIHCDYCHKIGGVYLNPATQKPYANVPGVESQVLLRPPEGDNIFIGPYDDIHDPDTYLPEISESVFCAPCHQFSMWGTPIYQSYAEWLASPYAEQNVTCQNCHMPPTGDTMFATVEAGGLEHAPDSIPSHLQLGAVSEDLLQNTVEMMIDLVLSGEQLAIMVTITNTQAGHHVPTDYPGRHMILVVRAEDANGDPLTLVEGPTVPEWGGPEAGQPGQAYAKVLRDVFTDESPVVSYWMQTQIASDNRIPALESDTSNYLFAWPPVRGDITVRATLVLRRVFYGVAETRGWDVPDMLMEDVSRTVAR